MSSQPVDEFSRFCRSFPVEIKNEVALLLPQLSIYSDHKTHWRNTFRLRGEELEMPNRLYWRRDKIRQGGLSMQQKTILNCLLSRHHSGYVREESLKDIIESNEYWVTPFIIYLLGDYVVEMLKCVDLNFKKINQENMIQFINENDDVWFLTKQRIASYWDCYHRHIKKSEYVGFRLIQKIEKVLNQQEL